mgnify:CR=1 FL=1|tara:strand:+ start:811 stop:1221 length:411 start_codon:yes stop_codon:yes gene_type:complete
MANDIILAKTESIERCLKRIREEYEPHRDNFNQNYTIQDSVVLNLQRACELSIDLAMHIVRLKKLGIPKQSRDAFNLLGENNIIDNDLAEKLGNMVGFRNIAIHEYRKLDLEIVKSIVEKNLHVFSDFAQAAIKLL